MLTLVILISSFVLNSRLCRSFPIDPTSTVQTNSDVVTLDLTHAFDEDTIYWPTAKRFRHDKVYRGYTDAGFYYESNDISASEHGGTHLDAPAHFCDPEGSVKCWRTDEIPVSRFRGEGVLIDVSSLASWPENRDFRLGEAELKARVEAWESARARRIPPGAFLVIYTGWGRFWEDESKYLGNDNRNASDLHFPGLHPDAASWLVTNRPWISMVGIDTASIDFGPSSDFAAHRRLLGANVPCLENLANVDRLAAMAREVEGEEDDVTKMIEITALPMKIRDGSGGPTRVIADVSSDGCRLNSCPPTGEEGTFILIP